MLQAEIRKLAAIMFTDIVGFSRQMSSDEARMLRLLEVHNRIIQQGVAEHHGTVIKTVGDAFLVDFPSVVHAVQCAQQIQAQLRTHNTEKEPHEQIHIRIGIHLGDIVQKDGDVFGDGVNIASRLQALAEPDTICISQKVYEEVAKKLDLGTVVSLGKPKLKNIVERFQVYALLPVPPTGLRQRWQVQRLKFKPFSTSLATISLLLIGGILALFLFRNPHSPIRNQEFPSLPDKPSILVLPFTNMSDDPKQEYFSDGITEDITSDLSKISSLFVIARNSAFTYKGKAVKVQDVSREMGVRYVLEGSVRKADNQVRITAQLIDATTGHHLWSERYDRPFSGIFALQDEIRQKIVFALKVKLTPEEQERFRSAPTNSLEAYDYFLRSLKFEVPLTKEANVQARQLCERALEFDPRYAGAYARLSLTYWLEWFRYGGQDQTLERAFELAQKATALDDSLPVAHQVLGWVYLMQKQHDQAHTEMERTITLDPNSALGYTGLSFVLHSSGRPQEAIPVAAKAVRLSPQDVNALNALGQAYVSAGQYEEAIAIFKKILARNPDYWAAHSSLAVVYSESGREREARAAGAEVLRITPNFSIERWKQRSFYKDPAVIERRAAALRKAGLK
jgi:adenylate cyclase